MSLTCALSGEPLATTKEDIVVTPSGHVCIKRLLLQKLTENGGMDPFEPIREIPLQEDRLVLLKSTSKSSSSIPPPRPQVTSLPNLLQNIQTEYDALVLELFDTRKALEETRKELSQALYQNDAAVRVVARLAQERDAARQELERWNASVGSGAGGGGGGGGGGADENAEAVEGEGGGGEEPQKKKRRIDTEEDESNNLPLKNNIPSEDYEVMQEAWEKSMQQRKPKLKAAAGAAPSKDDLAQFKELDSKAWHKSTCRGLTGLISYGDFIVTAGKDKQVVVYHTEEKVVKHTFSGISPSCMDVNDNVLVIGDAKGKIAAYSLREGDDDRGGVRELQLDNTEGIVDIRIHTSSQQVCVATGNGQVHIMTLTADGLKHVGYFPSSDNDDDKGVECTSGAMQPDGLLYAVGTNSGKLLVFDFKNKILTSSLPDLDEEDAVVTVTFSNNGYHLASAHESGTVRFWDLKKAKLLASLNGEKDLLDSVTKIAYDESGKYVAMAGAGGVKITTVKEWGITASFDVPAKEGKVSGIAWLAGGKDIVSCSDKKRQVRFFGTQES